MKNRWSNWRTGETISLVRDATEQIGSCWTCNNAVVLLQLDSEQAATETDAGRETRAETSTTNGETAQEAKSRSQGLCQTILRMLLRCVQNTLAVFTFLGDLVLTESNAQGRQRLRYG